MCGPSGAYGPLNTALFLEQCLSVCLSHHCASPVRNNHCIPTQALSRSQINLKLLDSGEDTPIMRASDICFAIVIPEN